jgi:hypothetical protein
VEDSVKQGLQDKLQTQGEDAVKADIQAIMVQAGELLHQNQQAEDLLPQAEQSYAEELREIDGQAADLSSDISKDLDAEELSQVREQLS